MPMYSLTFKARMVQRLVGPQAVSATRLATEVGVPQATLSRWLSVTRSVGGMTRPGPKGWTGAEKLRVVLATHGLDETALGALLRREGLVAAQLTAWRTVVETALSAPERSGRTAASLDAKRIQELERELTRKDRALAETAALLVLKKKAQLIWGDVDEPTTPRRAR